MHELFLFVTVQLIGPHTGNTWNEHHHGETSINQTRRP